jgi:uncharacterized protein
VNDFNHRDIIRAIMKGDIPSLEGYFANGLSSDATTEKEGWNLLHQATMLAGKPANAKAVEFLLKKGVPVNDQDKYGNLPLYYSVRNNDVAIVQMLIDCGSDINVLNREGVSPLHQVLLSASINIELLKLLLLHGAKTTFGDVSEFAKSIDNSSVNDLFEQYAG